MKRLMIYCMLFLTVAACTKKEKPLCDGEKTSYAIIIDVGESRACDRIALYSDYFETSSGLVYSIDIPEEFRKKDLKVKISYCLEEHKGLCPTMNIQPRIKITKTEKVNE